LSFGFDGPEDEKGMLETVSSINALISTELSSTEVDASRVIIGGFSQGGAMSLLTGLSNERKLAGVAVLSGWLPLKDKFKAVSGHLFRRQIRGWNPDPYNIHPPNPDVHTACLSDTSFLGTWHGRPFGLVQIWHRFR
jgi:poly(3-hydroxybutyrate) depolymerase